MGVSSLALCLPKKEDLTWDRLRKLLLTHFLVIGLAVALAVALAWPYPGAEVSQIKVGSFHVVQTINICTIFFISGFTLDTQDILTAITAFRSLGYGLLAILIITPALGFGIVELPLGPKEFALGLTIFSAVPTTIASGVTMVDQAQGNVALALALTVGSNLAGVATVPFTVNLIVTHVGSMEFDTLALLVKLLSTILLPLIVGKGLRELISCLRRFGREHELLLRLISTFSLVLMIWQVLSRSRDVLLEQKCRDVGTVLAAGVAMHLIYLAWNFIATKVLRLPSREKKAVLIMASQKTLPVSLSVIAYLEDDLYDQALLAVPCILGHLAQIFIDAMIVSRWAPPLGRVGSRSDGVELEACATFGSPHAVDGLLKGEMKVVDNPLAKDLSRNGMDESGYGISAVVVEGTPSADTSEGERSSLQVLSVMSSEDSFQSARTVFSTGTYTSAHETPRDEV